MATSGIVLVTGATGTVGKPMVSALQARGAKIRLLLHDTEKAKVFPEGNYEFVVGDLGKPETLEHALKDVERVLLLTLSTPNQVEIERGFLAVAKKAGVRHIVRISVFGANPAEPSTSLIRWHAYAENTLIESGITYTILRPNLFFQNFLRDDAATIKSSGVFYRAVDPTTRISSIDVRDIADVAATALTEPIEKHANQTYNLTGPESFTYDELAKVISEVIGKEVKPVYIDDVALHRALTSRPGMPAFLLSMLRTLFQFYRTNLASVVCKDIEIVTGKPARSAKQFFTDHKQYFQ